MRRALIVLLAALAAAAPAEAHAPATAATAIASSVAEPCPGDPIRIDQLVTGTFDASLQGGHALVPFDVPAGTTAVRVKYCFDQPEAPVQSAVRPGRWTAELGLAAIARRDQGDLDDRVAWRVEVELSSDPAFADEPYRPARHRRRSARRRAGCTRATCTSTPSTPPSATRRWPGRSTTRSARRASTSSPSATT